MNEVTRNGLKLLPIELDPLVLTAGPNTFLKNQQVPISFRIDNNPSIRGRQLNIQGHTAEQIAEHLKLEFSLNFQQTASILSNEGFTAPETAGTLLSLFNLGAAETAGLLKSLDFEIIGIAQALQQVFGLDAHAAAEVLKEIRSCCQRNCDGSSTSI